MSWEDLRDSRHESMEQAGEEEGVLCTTQLSRSRTPLHVEVIRVRINWKGQDRIHVTVRDVSERHRLEQSLQQAQKLESIGRLAGGVAHDQNNMLSVILGYTELALRNVAVDTELHEDLTEIQEAAMRSAQITRHLLAFARKQAVSPRMLDLNETVAGMLRLLQRLIGDGIELEWMPARDLHPIFMDPVQVDQILANLCVNARDAMGETGRIVVRTSNRTLNPRDVPTAPGAMVPSGMDWVVLEVQDGGCGMDPQIQDHIFEPFFTTKPKERGTGLGLSTVWGIATQNGGWVEVESLVGQGSCFSVWLPSRLNQDNGVTDSSPVEPVCMARGETVFLVEDEQALLAIPGRMLGDLGYKVHMALSPRQALRMLRDEHLRPDILLTDLNLPQMNGVELATNMKEQVPGIRVLYMSGQSSQGEDGEKQHPEPFLSKPFSLLHLSQALRKVLVEG